MTKTFDPHSYAHHLDRVADRIDEHTGDVLGEVAQAVAHTQRLTVPRDTGDTARSITVTDPQGSQLRRNSTEALIGPTDEAAVFIEYGTEHHGPDPFVFDAGARHEPGFAHDVGVAARGAILQP